MKKKLLLSLAVLTIGLTAFTLFGYFYTRGLRVYLLSTKTGGFFAAAWQYTALISALLWIALAIVGVSWIVKKAKKAALKPSAGPREGTFGGGAAADGTGKKKSGEKIPPKTAAKDTAKDAGRKIPPKGPAGDARPRSGDDNAPNDKGPRKETSKLFGTDKGSDATTLVDGEDPKDATELLTRETGEEETQKTELVSAAPADGGAGTEAAVSEALSNGETPRPAPSAAVKEIDGSRQALNTPRDTYCSKCGAKVTGKNFCPYCGTKVGS